MVQFSGLEKVALCFIVALLVYLVYVLCLFLYNNVIGPIVNKVDFKSKGKWALITGCTDGIGKEYARQLAAQGCDIVLVSRSLDKLNATSEELVKEFKVNTKVVQADFSEGEHIYDDIAKAISGLEIGTLVNNVGVSYNYPEYFLNIPDCEKTMNKMVSTNIVSLTRMAGLVMPEMVERKRGVVINIGSASSAIPSPLLTGYAASKAYVEKFTEGLQMEYASKGIIVQCIMPGFVCSNMSGIRRSSIMAPTAKQFVQSALKSVGTVAKTTGYLPHTVFMNAVNLIHTCTGSFGVWLVTRSMENTRRKAMKKYKN